MAEGVDETLRTMAREFRASVSNDLTAAHQQMHELSDEVRAFRTSLSNDLTATHRQMNELSDEVRTRITTAEAAILNAVQDLGRDVDRRLGLVEQRVAGTDARLQRIEDTQRG